MNNKLDEIKKEYFSYCENIQRIESNARSVKVDEFTQTSLMLNLTKCSEYNFHKKHFFTITKKSTTFIREEYKKY